MIGVIQVIAESGLESASRTLSAERFGGLTSLLYEVSLRADRHRGELAAELGLGTTDVAALWWVATRSGWRPADLARSLGIGVAGTSSVVDKLVRSGFVRRAPHPTDRRSTVLEVTPAGRLAHGWMTEELGRVVAAALGAELDPVVAAQVVQRLADAFETVRPAG